MEKYLEGNQQYWQKGYEAENLESHVFRPYGRIFRDELGITGANHERLLDFGCGSGAALRFFKSKGFDVYGVDISVPDIARCKQRMPDVADHFGVIDGKPCTEDIWFGGQFDVVIGIQSFYYFPNKDFDILMRCIYNQMKLGAIIYGSMIGTKCWYYRSSTEAGDGLRNVSVCTKRLKFSDYFVNFTSSEEHLLEKFRLFKRLHVGYYDRCYLEDEGSEFHYIFIGQKT